MSCWLSWLKGNNVDMFDWLKGKEELGGKALPQHLVRDTPTVGEPVLKLLSSLKEDQWECEQSKEYPFSTKTIRKKDNTKISFLLSTYCGYGFDRKEELLGYDWMTEQERTLVHNAVNDVFNVNYSKQVNQRKEEQRLSFANKLNGVAEQQHLPDVGEPVLSLLKAMEDVDDWRLSIEREDGKAQGQTYMKASLHNKTHTGVVLEVCYWKADKDCGKPSLYFLSSTENGFTTHERSVVNEEINKLMHKQQEMYEAARFNEARNRFMVLVNEENE